MQGHFFDIGWLSQSFLWLLTLLFYRSNEIGCFCYYECQWWSNDLNPFASKKWFQRLQSGKNENFNLLKLIYTSVYFPCSFNGHVLSKCIFWTQPTQVWTSYLGRTWTLAHGWLAGAHGSASSRTAFWGSCNTTTALSNQLRAISSHTKRKIPYLPCWNQEMLIIIRDKPSGITFTK